MRDGEREQDEGMGREGKRGEKLLFSFERQLIVFRKPCSSVGVIGARKRRDTETDRDRQQIHFRKNVEIIFLPYIFAFVYPYTISV